MNMNVNWNTIRKVLALLLIYVYFLFLCLMVQFADDLLSKFKMENRDNEDLLTSQQINDPIAKVELMFKTVDTNLDEIATRIDKEFCNEIGSLQNPGNLQLINPVEVLSRIRAVKAELASVVQGINEIQEAEKEAMNFFRTEMMATCQSLMQLQIETGSTMSVKIPENFKRFEDLIAIHSSSDLENRSGNELINGRQIKLSSSTSAKVPAAEPTNEIESVLQCTENDEECEHDSSVFDSNDVADLEPVPQPKPAQSAWLPAVKSSHFQPVTENRFETVSSLVRGRVTVAEVNNTYEKLWKYFTGTKNSKPLTAVDMDKMGLRVSGRTGVAKLKVLQCLKLIQMSSKGDVVKLIA